MGKGDMARQMIHAPKAEGAGNRAETHPDVDAEAIPESTGTAIGDAMRDAAIASSVESAEVAANGHKGQAELLAALFSNITFRLPERDQSFPDRNNPAISNRRVAYVSCDLGGILDFETSIYAKEETVKDASGTFLQQTFSVSMPRHITAPRDNPIAQSLLNDWKQTTLDAYEVWANKVETSSPVGRKGNGPRLVKRTAVAV